MKTIGVIHASENSIRPVRNAINKMYPDTKIINYLNENLTARFVEKSMVDEKSLRIFAKLVFEALETELDGILVACSVYCPYVPLLRNFGDTPIMAIDAPMIKNAAITGSKIGILATNSVAGPLTQEQILNIASQKGRAVETIVHQCKDAAEALAMGNTERHDSLIAQAALDMKKHGCDTVVLCQISMANAANLINKEINILTSMDEGLRTFFETIIH